MASISPGPSCKHTELHAIDIQNDYKVYTCVNCQEFVKVDESMDAETLQQLLEFDASNKDEVRVNVKRHQATCENCGKDSDSLTVLACQPDEDAGEAVSNQLVKCRNCNHTQTIYVVAADNGYSEAAVNNCRDILTTTCDKCHQGHGDLFQVLNIECDGIDTGDVVTRVRLKCLPCGHKQTYSVVGDSSKLSSDEFGGIGDKDNLPCSQRHFKPQREEMSNFAYDDCHCDASSVCDQPQANVDACRKCNSRTADRLIEKVYDAEGNLILLHCWKCDEDLPLPGGSFQPPHRSDHVKSMNYQRQKSGTGGCSSSSSRRQINDLRELRRGDHIAFHRPDLICRHAIVADVQLSGCRGKVTVIHNSGAISEVTHSRTPNVRQEEIDIDLRKDEVYRYDSDGIDGRRYSADEIVLRARSRVGEKYSMLECNGEHFARWCTIREQKSEQCQTFDERVKTDGCKAEEIPSKVTAFLKECAANVLSPQLGKIISGATPMFERLFQEILKKLPKVDVDAKVCYVGSNLITEVLRFVTKVIMLYQQFKAGQISKRDLKKQLLKYACEGLGVVVGGAVGFIVGSILISVPVIGGIIGCSIGNFLGLLLMSMIEPAIAKLLCRSDCAE